MTVSYLASKTNKSKDISPRDLLYAILGEIESGGVSFSAPNGEKKQLPMKRIVLVMLGEGEDPSNLPMRIDVAQGSTIEVFTDLDLAHMLIGKSLL